MSGRGRLRESCPAFMPSQNCFARAVVLCTAVVVSCGHVDQCFRRSAESADHPPSPAGRVSARRGGVARGLVDACERPAWAGYRIPTIVVSPWTAGGWVSSQLFDHTSSLRLLERVTGVKEPNISEWRRKTFGDFTSVFRFDDAKSKPPSLPDTSGPLVLARRDAARLPKPSLVPQPQAEPSQEKGTRRRVT